LCWAEKADNYSAQCRTAASGNEDRARSSGESKIIVYFRLSRHLHGNWDGYTGTGISRILLA
jgi:hypothetical protein